MGKFSDFIKKCFGKPAQTITKPLTKDIKDSTDWHNEKLDMFSRRRWAKQDSSVESAYWWFDNPDGTYLKDYTSIQELHEKWKITEWSLENEDEKKFLDHIIPDSLGFDGRPVMELNFENGQCNFVHHEVHSKEEYIEAILNECATTTVNLWGKVRLFATPPYTINYMALVNPQKCSFSAVANEFAYKEGRSDLASRFSNNIESEIEDIKKHLGDLFDDPQMK